MLGVAAGPIERAHVYSSWSTALDNSRLPMFGKKMALWKKLKRLWEKHMKIVQ